MRSVRQLHPAVSDDIGNLRTQRPLPNPRLRQIDPFLFLNHHGPQVYPPDNEGLPFGPHPHRGFETVTFIVEGSLAHRDSGGHESVIHAGGVQWMTAGRGLEHSELSPDGFLRDGGALEILQLWVNLPSRLKMIEPRYIGLQQSEIPAIALDEGRVLIQLVTGEWDGTKGAVDSYIGMHLMSIELGERGRVSLPAPAAHSVFLYVVRGEVNVGGRTAAAFHLVEMNSDGDELVVEASKPSLILFGHAAPLGEPVVAHGPFVMNSAEEIMQAVRDYQAGKFS
jgi:redox-sensitive bicupin YhaK (pirin superfamily)